MDWQGVVMEIRRGRLLVEPLDGAHPIWLRVPRCDRTYIEHEVLQLAPLSSGTPPGVPVTVEVLGSGCDPTYIDDRPPGLESRGGEEDEHGFAEYVSYEDSEPFELAMEHFRAGRIREARRAFRQFIARHPLHIDSYHHLGILAGEDGYVEQALKYYEMGYEIGWLTLPSGFDGRLPWGVLDNRPFLRVCHGRALALMKFGRTIDAASGLAEILRFNPNDNQGVRYLLASLLVSNGSLSRAGEFLDEVGPDGTNLYTRCLIDILQGRRRDALRWLCAAVSSNPYVPGILVQEASRDTVEAPRSVCITAGGPTEAIEYVEHHGALWRSGRAAGFLERMLRIDPFAERLTRVLEIERQLQGLSPGDERARLVDERFALFGVKAISSIVTECDPHL